jgi:hypothetical protein
MIRTQVSLDAKVYEEAKREARRQGVSLAELVRRGLSLVLAAARQQAPPGSGADQQPWMRHAASLCSGDPTSSTSVDQVVHGRERP